MPEWLLSVISGILAGGIPGFRIELCCFYHPLAWPLCVVPCRLCFASFSVAILKMTHKMSSFVLCLRAGSDPTFLCFVVLVLLWFCVFFCLFALFVVWFSMGLLTGLCICPLPALHDNLQFIFLLRLNVCNDLAKAMKALDGKKDSAASGHSDHFAWVQSHFRIFCIFGSVRKVGLQLTWNASEDDCTLKFIRKGHSRFSGFFSFFQSKHLRKWWAIHTKGRL